MNSNSKQDDSDGSTRTIIDFQSAQLTCFRLKVWTDTQRVATALWAHLISRDRNLRRNVSYAAIGILLVVLFPGCADESESAASQIAEPVSLTSTDVDPELAKSLTNLLESARAYPRSSDRRGRLAMAYDSNGFTDAAATTYEQAETLNSGVFMWPYSLALLQAQRGDLENALQSLGRALAIDDKYPPAWLFRGAWLLDEGRTDDAMDAYNRARELAASPAEITGRARILLRLGRADEALVLLEPLVEEVSHPYIYRTLGRVYRGLGRTDDAHIAFARGRLSEPLGWRDPRSDVKSQYISGFGGLLTHAGTLLSEGEYENALKILEQLREQRPDEPEMLNKLSYAYAFTGQQERAFEVIRHGLESKPDYYFFHQNLAAFYLQQGDTERGLSHQRRAVALNPLQGGAHRQLGMILKDMGQYDEALAAFDIALRCGIANPQQVHYFGGLIEAFRENWPAAIQKFTTAVDIDVSFTLAHVRLGRSLAEAGRFNEAESTFAWADRLATHPQEIDTARRRLAVLRTTDLEGSQ